ncbi:DMT family transporter [Aliamphritea spongicola]|uniref:DMT family transporter n=1 Tax=Aliamphritea spongicola TaxID=707589 RepID=UPI00196A3B61|nr:DMT family transporter [Aliamphritea spongicola]MBN3563721.1 DMT family transporter [Aliamphritea spongicola]
MNQALPQAQVKLIYPVGAILLAVFALSLGDALIKALSLSFPLWQLFVMRSIVAVIPLILLIHFLPREQGFRPKARGWVALRSLMLTFQWVAYYAALPTIDLSVAGATFYTLPLFITLFAACVLGEHIRPLGWLAIGLGFTGVLIMLRPGADDFSLTALLPLVGAILYALSMVLTRAKCQQESPLVLGLSLHLTIFTVGAVASIGFPLLWPDALQSTGNQFIFGAWTDMGITQWLAMSALAVAAVIGAVGGAYAYQNGPSATVATFDYSYLAFLTVWGILFFAEIPDIFTLSGMALIITAGILAVRQK